MVFAWGLDAFDWLEYVGRCVGVLKRFLVECYRCDVGEVEMFGVGEKSENWKVLCYFVRKILKWFLKSDERKSQLEKIRVKNKTEIFHSIISALVVNNDAKNWWEYNVGQVDIQFI